MSAIQPHAMVAAWVICADTDERARWLAGPSALSFLQLRQQGRPGLEDLLKRTEADELMLTAQTHDPADRLRSFELVANVVQA